MKILHICNNYVASKVHKKLICLISSKGDHIQDIYVPIRTSVDSEKNFISTKDINIHYFNYKFDFLKYFPLLKILIVFIGFILTSSKKKPDIVIAHNFWSDGIIAFLNYIFFNIPYILVVRNTDINVFLPKLKHYHWLMSLMVKNSRSLIFINKPYRDKFQNDYPKLYKKANNVSLIFNGIDNFWLKNMYNLILNHRSNTLIYVGAFNKNKNIVSIINATANLVSKINNLTLILVGGSISDLKILLNSKEIPDFIKVMGKINDKEILLKLYREAKIFIMPSFFETFGLVYIEALSQGCSIIHSNGQGIDGVFNENFIQAVDPYNVDDIACKIEYLLENYDLREDNGKLYHYISNQFSWENIADKYLEELAK